MNSSNNVDYPIPSQVSVKIEELNGSQVVSLHIFENDVPSEIFIPDVYVPKDSVPLINGSKTGIISVENQIIPIINEIKPKVSQYSNLHAEADKSFIIPKPQVSGQSHTHKIYKKIKSYKDVIPNSSNHYAINKQIELIHPLNYAKSTPVQCESFQNKNSLHVATPKTDPINELKNPLGFINCPSKEIINFLDQPFESLPQDSSQVNPQPLDYASKPAKVKNVPELSSKGSGDQTNKTPVKRKVQNYVHISDVRVPQRAIAVLPTVLQIRGKDNIFPRRTIPARIRFGPLEGVHKVVTPLEANVLSKADAPMFLLKKDNEIIHIDVSDKDKCNWMGLLPAGGEANVWLYQENNELYAITTEPINARRPLRLGYSKKYAEDHKLPTGVPILDLETVLSSNPKQWWCNECNRALPSAAVLQRHADVYHKDDGTRRRYHRCLQCRRMFSRLFSLRRHLSKHCMKKPEKPLEPTESNSSLDLNTLNNEDNRMPSDESFQNFSNGLDFTTTLFDTDRISNIDISGNSRTDNDFNPYDITFRDDTCTSNDLSFSKLTSEPFNSSDNKVNKKSALDPCTYCSQVVTKGNKRKHSSECPSNKKQECACGKSFRNKEKLAQHFLKAHPTDDSNHNPPEKDKYTCEQCNSKRFKRRGMLVNHLWRVHKIVPTSKVECLVWHYPCVACPKIYRSAAKRDRHITIHHPGAEKLATQSIAGGVRSCEPAICSHCPRQYATRAKLMQHVRAQHAHVLAAVNA